jgi:hypothetical protein
MNLLGPKFLIVKRFEIDSRLPIFHDLPASSVFQWSFNANLYTVS